MIISDLLPMQYSGFENVCVCQALEVITFREGRSLY
jgi:hypothetical protein